MSSVDLHTHYSYQEVVFYEDGEPIIHGEAGDLKIYYCVIYCSNGNRR
ncbi:TPA_asm: hypothetical protein HUJ06_000120 [Nelumbo nucifera]|nr:TPA_asm: hypothetical protein HUJ06_000120 [Nelumbo nucifera]